MSLEGWKGFIVGLFTDRSARVAAAALVIALVLAGAVSRFMGGFPGPGQLNSPQQVVVTAVLIAAFAMTWFILYILTRQELVDVFTKVRK